MKKSLSFLGASYLLLVPTQAASLAYWNFNNLGITGTVAVTPGTNGLATSIPADSGTGSLNLAGYGGLVDDFAGSTINAISPDVAEESLSLVSGGTAAPFPGNGTYIELISLNFTGASDIGITYATRGTASGFNSGIWSYSISGGAFTNVPGSYATTNTTFALTSVDLTAITALNDASNVTLRYTLSGATSTTGNNRIDNLQVVSDFVPVPEASTAVLGLLAGLGLMRRRR